MDSIYIDTWNAQDLIIGLILKHNFRYMAPIELELSVSEQNALLDGPDSPGKSGAKPEKMEVATGVLVQPEGENVE